MQTFFVPQFIDVESKILGPISVRQFSIIIVCGGLIYVGFKLFSFFPFLLFAVIVGFLGGSLAFGKVNGQMMHYFLLNVIQTLKRPNLRVWKRSIILEHNQRVDAAAEPILVTLKDPLAESRLAQISLTVDTGGIYSDIDASSNPNISSNQK